MKGTTDAIPDPRTRTRPGANFFPDAFSNNTAKLFNSPIVEPGSSRCLDHEIHKFHEWTVLAWRFPSPPTSPLAGVRRSQAKSLLIRVIRVIRGFNGLFQVETPTPGILRHANICAHFIPGARGFSEVRGGTHTFKEIPEPPPSSNNFLGLRLRAGSVRAVLWGALGLLSLGIAVLLFARRKPSR
jgi:hypothetical protein